MQFLCIAAILLSATAAQTYSGQPWQDEEFPSSGGPNLDADFKRSDEQLVTPAPEDGDQVSDEDWSEEYSGRPPHERPQNGPSGRPGNGNPRGPMRWTDENEHHQPGRPTGPIRGKRLAPDLKTDEPRVVRAGRFWNHRGPPRGRWPVAMEKMEFSPVFKADNVTFQNVTAVPLKEGDNIFLMPKHGGRGHHHHKRGKHGSLENWQYVKLIFNSTQMDKIFIEYGVLKPMKLSEAAREENDPEEAVWKQRTVPSLFFNKQHVFLRHLQGN